MPKNSYPEIVKEFPGKMRKRLAKKIGAPPGASGDKLMLPRTPMELTSGLRWFARLGNLVHRDPTVQGRLGDGVQRLGALLQQHLGDGHVFGRCTDQIQLMHGLCLSLASRFAP